MDYYIQVWKKSAIFNGRSQRAEYWYFMLYTVIFSIVFGIIIIFLNKYFDINYKIIMIFYHFIMIRPILSVSVRRLHDIGKSGSIIFINLIPVIGFLWYIVLMTRDGVLEENEYGSNPKKSIYSTDSYDEILNKKLEDFLDSRVKVVASFRDIFTGFSFVDNKESLGVVKESSEINKGLKNLLILVQELQYKLDDIEIFYKKNNSTYINYAEKQKKLTPISKAIALRNFQNEKLYELITFGLTIENWKGGSVEDLIKWMKLYQELKLIEEYMHDFKKEFVEPSK